MTPTVLILAVAFIATVQGRSPPGPPLDPICPGDWSFCTEPRQCPSGCCTEISILGLPTSKCCVPPKYIYAFRPRGVCGTQISPSTGRCPPLRPPPKFDVNAPQIGCPRIIPRYECREDGDCGFEEVCCDFAVALGCFGGKKCTPAV